MNVLMAVVVGVMVACGLYLMMQRRLLHLLLGIALLGNGVNVSIIISAGITPDNPPVIPADRDVPLEPYADPLPQALVLTAIVIGFGVLGFAVALAWRSFHLSRDDDMDKLVTTEGFGSPENNRPPRGIPPPDPDPGPASSEHQHKEASS
ncbi:MAG: cation:proton antiporter [Planctomycetota bacterium]|nr:MAG: cation:proton antiporter [Planctomycetota bacterium]